MRYVAAKTLLTPVRHTDEWIDRNFNMNIYRGCCHGCVYCDSRALRYNIEHFDEVRAKDDVLTKLARELKVKRKPGLIGTGAASDPYNPFEEELELTRGSLKLIAQYGFGVSVTTKSPLATRDIDILRDIGNAAPANVQITITATDDDWARRFEPRAPSSSARFGALEKLSAAGIYTGVFIMPVLPWITDDDANIAALVRRAGDAGAKNIICFPGMTLREGNREYYYDFLRRDFPGLRAKYEERFGNAYVCESPRASDLWETFARDASHRGQTTAPYFEKNAGASRRIWERIARAMGLRSTSPN